MKTFLGVHYPSTGRRDNLGAFRDAGYAGLVTFECGYPIEQGCFYATRFQANGNDNPPNFYTDPLQAARDHFNGQQQKWQQNPGAMARLSNNELDIETPWHGDQQVIFDLEFMRLCETVGEHAAICNYSGGNPSDNALVDGTPCSCEDRWRSVLPAVKYAGEHDHFIALHIHQQDTGPMESPGGQSVSLRHRRAIAYWLRNDLHPECVITRPPRIIFNEVSNGVGGVEPNLHAYILSVTWLDQQLRSDPYNSLYTILALYQAGGGEPISAEAYQMLADYVEPLPEIVINPLPANEFIFQHYANAITGVIYSTDPNYDLTLLSDMAIKAQYVPKPPPPVQLHEFTLTVDPPSEAHRVTQNPSGTMFPHGQVIQLRAV